MNKETENKYLKILQNNSNNLIVDFDNKKEFIKALTNIKNMKLTFGYLVIINFKVSEFLQSLLGIENDLVLMISKTKVKEIMDKHGVNSEIIFKIIKKTSSSPEAIVFDSKRNSYQFGIKIDEKNYRAVIEFNVIPKGIKIVKAHILTSLFKEKRYEKRLENIKKGNIDNLFLVYEDISSRTAIVIC